MAPWSDGDRTILIGFTPRRMERLTGSDRRRLANRDRVQMALSHKALRRLLQGTDMNTKGLTGADSTQLFHYPFLCASTLVAR